MKQESSTINPYNGIFGQQGWICPKCGRVYSPYTQMCPYCGGNNTLTNLDVCKQINEYTSKGDSTCDRSNTPVNEEELKYNRKVK